VAEGKKRRFFQKTLYKNGKKGYHIPVYGETRMRQDAAAYSAKRAGGWCNSGREARQEITCPAALLNQVGKDGLPRYGIKMKWVSASTGTNFRPRLYKKRFFRLCRKRVRQHAGANLGGTASSLVPMG
jgi:hypothetical protein